MHARVKAPLQRLGMSLAAVILVVGCGGDAEVEPPAPPTSAAGDREDGARDALEALGDALRRGDAAAAAAVAAPGSAPRLRAAAENASALGLREVTLRYVDEGATLTGRQRARYGEDAWAAAVEMTYRIEAVEQTPAHVDTSIVFRQQADTVTVAGLGGAGGRTPLWWSGPVTVRTAGRAVVFGPRAAAVARVAPMARDAVRRVNADLPEWTGGLVVELPGSAEGLRRAIDAEPGQYDNIAAVTTTVDGSLTKGSPVHVFVNPRVFNRLDARGAQVVIAHEATHVATDATLSSMPNWLLEGFADYVALDGYGVPVQTAAAQILDQIRAEGLPERLPTPEELAPTADDLGATYELAWLACRSLAQAYGEERLVAFYRAVDRGESVEGAFESELGVSQAEFVRSWRSDLAELAGVADPG